MANETIGEIADPHSGQRAAIRRAQRGRFPLYYVSPWAGPVFMRTPAGQDWLLEHGTFYGADGGDPPDAPTDGRPEPLPEPDRDRDGGDFWEDF